MPWEYFSSKKSVSALTSNCHFFIAAPYISQTFFGVLQQTFIPLPLTSVLSSSCSELPSHLLFNPSKQPNKPLHLNMLVPCDHATINSLFLPMILHLYLNFHNAPLHVSVTFLSICNCATSNGSSSLYPGSSMACQ